MSVGAYYGVLYCGAGRLPWAYGLGLSSLAKILYSMSECRAQELEGEGGRKREKEKEDIQESKFSTT